MSHGVMSSGIMSHDVMSQGIMSLDISIPEAGYKCVCLNARSIVKKVK